MSEFEIWKQRFIGAYAALCDDLEEAVEVAAQWNEGDINCGEDCPVESARKTYDERDVSLEAAE